MHEAVAAACKHTQKLAPVKCTAHPKFTNTFDSRRSPALQALPPVANTGEPSLHASIAASPHPNQQSSTPILGNGTPQMRRRDPQHTEDTGSISQTGSFAQHTVPTIRAEVQAPAQVCYTLVIEALLQAEADAYLENVAGKTAMDLAVALSADLAGRDNPSGLQVLRRLEREALFSGNIRFHVSWVIRQVQHGRTNVLVSGRCMSGALHGGVELSALPFEAG